MTRPTTTTTPGGAVDRHAPKRRPRVADLEAPPRAFDRNHLDEVESIALIGSYELDITTGRWTSSKGLDGIFGIDREFDRSVGGWASLIHPEDRDSTISYFVDEVIGGGRPFNRQYRIVQAGTGAMRWVHGRGSLVFDAGRPIRMLGTIADITEQRVAQEALAASEHRYAALFENTIEAILVVEQSTTRVRWANPAAGVLLGHDREELVTLSVADLVPAEGRSVALAGLHALALGQTLERDAVLVRRDGRLIAADVRLVATLIDGAPFVVAFLSDVTERRRLEAQDRMLATAISQVNDAILLTDPDGRIEYVNPAFERLTGRATADLVGGGTDHLETPQSTAAFGEMWGRLSTGSSWAGDVRHRRQDGTELIAEASISPVHAADGTVTGFVSVERDVTSERVLAAERARLQAAIEQTSDAVIITDVDGTIDYVNPAFEQISGYRRDEALGANPRILKSGRQSAAFYRAMWHRLGRGETWSGRFSNRRKDGGTCEVEATISPIRDATGATVGYVGVQRDITTLLATRSSLAAEFRERAAVATALARLRPRATAEETAADICEGLLGLTGIDYAGIVYFLDAERTVPLAVRGPANLPLATGRPLPLPRAEYLYQRATQGPWAEAWRPRPEDGAYGEQVADMGIRAVAHAPIRDGQGLLGLVSIGTCDEAFASHLIDHMPAVGEFAATASALLSHHLERTRRDASVRLRIGRVLAERAFSPVFQPIVAFASGSRIGYEALTRFADGTPPDVMISDAHSVGLGLDLELACMTAALDATTALPRDLWLSLNASPHLLAEHDRLSALLGDRTRRRPRQIVLEITEHSPIDDYDAIRRAVAELGPHVSLAVDDAGAGFASLRHIVELAPRYVKLDISLVQQVHRDLPRQAMIAGLSHFASRSGCEVIAEGIEEDADLEMLRELGVPFGQGYLLGRPGPLTVSAVR